MSTSPGSNLRLGITIPLANEEHCLLELFDRIRPFLDPEDRVFCVLDRMSNCLLYTSPSPRD